jgi:hypothetical protein
VEEVMKVIISARERLYDSRSLEQAIQKNQTRCRTEGVPAL